MTHSPEVSQAVLEAVKDVLVDTLGIDDRADDLGPDTELVGNLPELDSLAIVELVVALQGRFGIEMEDDDIVGDNFATLGQLAALVQSRSAGSGEV
jgi:acyl carrier protein